MAFRCGISTENICNDKREFLSKLRKEKRESILLLKRITTNDISTPNESYVESPPLSPKRYENIYTTFYQQLNGNELVESEVDNIVNTLFKNSSRQNHPPFTEMFSSGVVYRLLNIFSLLTLQQKRTVLMIIQNVTGFDEIYNSELLKYNIDSILSYSIGIDYLFESCCGCLSNLIVDSPDFLKKLLCSNILALFRNKLQVLNDVPYTTLWFIRCLMCKTTEKSVISTFVPILLQMLNTSQSKAKTIIYITFRDIVDVNIESVVISKLLESIVSSFNEDDNQTLFCSLLLLKRITEVFWCKELDEIISVLLSKSSVYDISMKRITFTILRNLCATSPNICSQLMIQEYFMNLPNEILISNDSEIKYNLTLICFLVMERCKPDMNTLTPQFKENLIKVISLIPIYDANMLKVTLNFLYFLMSTNFDRIYCEDISLRDWLDRVIVTQEISIRQLAQFISKEIFVYE